MLAPHDRSLLLDPLRPPPGFVLDRAIGTTFSLDLLALITVPLAFTFFGWQQDDDGPDTDPLMLLEALRRHADRVTIFCQAGRIAIPREHRLLFNHLEGSVVGVVAPNPSGPFHPKLWVLRFTAKGRRPRYRLLVPTRNLSFDCSWDTLLVLDGRLTARKNAYARNHPLGDFLEALPGLAAGPLSDDLLQAVDRMQDEIRRVDFVLPEGFEELQFWPLGHDGRRGWPFEGRIDRILVVSPFLGADTLRRLTEKGEGHALVSRLEVVDEVEAAILERFERRLVLSPYAEGDGAAYSTDENGRASGAEGTDDTGRLSGAGRPDESGHASGATRPLQPAQNAFDDLEWTRLSVGR